MARRWQLLLAGAVLLAAVAVIVAIRGGDDASPSVKDYQASVVNTRDRVDFALGQLPEARSEDDFLARLDEAGSLIKEAADDFDDAGSPTRFEDASEELVRHLRQLSADVRGTAAQVRDIGFDKLLAGASGLNFPSWDKANATLAELREQGVDVKPIGRH